MDVKKNHLNSIILWVFVTMFLSFLLYPFWIAICTSFKSLHTFFDTKVFIPALMEGTFQPYIEAFDKILTPMLHSLVIAVITTFIAIYFGMIGGYVLTAGRFKGAGLVFTLVVFAIYIPGSTKLLPTLKIVQFLGLYDTNFSVGLSVGSMMLPLSTILFRQFYVSIPKSFFEVAELSGADHLQIFRRIIIPLSKIPIVTVTVLSFGVGWNVFMFPLVLTTGTYTDRPVGVALSSMRSAAVQDGTFNVMISGAIIASVLPIIFYLFAQKHVTNGFRSMGGVDK